MFLRKPVRALLARPAYSRLWHLAVRGSRAGASGCGAGLAGGPARRCTRQERPRETSEVVRFVDIQAGARDSIGSEVPEP